MQTTIINPTFGWYRSARGCNFQFFATDEEVLEMLLTKLPLEYAPYTFIGINSIKIDKHYHQVAYTSPIENLLEILNNGKWFNRLWIWSQALTPHFPLETDNPDALCSLNGLISLNHGNKRQRGAEIYRDVSNIGIVDKVFNYIANEEIFHEAYFKIFSKLKRYLRSILIYNSMVSFPNGTFQEVNYQRMTLKAVESFEQGYPFVNAPSQRIK